MHQLIKSEKQRVPFHLPKQSRTHDVTSPCFITAPWMHLVPSSSSLSISGPSDLSKSQMEPHGASKMFDPSIVYLAAKPLITQSMTVATETGGHCLASVKALWVTLSPSHKYSLISPTSLLFILCRRYYEIFGLFFPDLEAIIDCCRPVPP